MILGALRKSPDGQMLSSLVSFVARTWTHKQDLANQVHLLHMESKVTGTKKQGQWRILSRRRLQDNKNIQAPKAAVIIGASSVQG